MSGYELSLEQLTGLVRAASPHHRRQIAGWVSLTAHTRKGAPYFRDASGSEVPLAEVGRLLRASPDAQRWAYNLYMNYAHFG